MKKPKTTPKELATTANAEAKQPNAAIAPKAAPKKTTPTKQPSKKTQEKVSKPVEEAPKLVLQERIGLTAGSIWHYLDKNGATPASKLIKALPEEEKIIQRSIGWLAQEGKITLATNGRVETVALKN